MSDRVLIDLAEIILKLARSASTEPPRVCRRLFRLSYATLAGISSLA